MDEKTVELLEKNGLKRIEAVALSLFVDGQPRSSVQIERAGNMRQPEVSVSMLSMVRRGWFRPEYVKKDAGKGRPYYVYHLTRTFKEIVEEVARARGVEIAGMMNDLNELRAVA